ncbi:MAG: MarR family transcriptional regulator [Lachnospiraceae bacterium]|nr:MarR family transcriptional regulator [Lachnospiraceae bacterium]
MEYRVGFEIKKLSNLIKKQIDRLSAESGLTGFQGYLMGYLIREGARRDLFQRDVEKHLEISRASVTSILQLLEKNGFIRRESVKTDARLKKIAVTEKGYQANDRILNSLDRLESNLTKGISPGEMEVFISVMERIKKNLEKLDY